MGLKDVLSILLVLSGLALVVFAYLGAGHGPSGPPQGQVVDREVDLKSLQEILPSSAAKGTPSSVLAVFLLHAKVCPPCLAELGEYASILATLDEPVRVERMALVFEESPGRAERFIKTAHLPVPAVRDEGSRLGELAGFEGVGSRQQLVFIDRERGTLFYQVPLFNTVTAVDYKRSVVANMLAARGEAGP